LGLHQTRVTDAGLEHLKGLTKLRYLHLDYTKVTDAGLEHLKGLTSLTELDIHNTKVTDEGVKKLRKALPNCKIRSSYDDPRPPQPFQGPANAPERSKLR